MTETQEMNGFPPADNEMAPAALSHFSSYFIHTDTALIRHPILHQHLIPHCSPSTALTLNPRTSITIPRCFFVQDIKTRGGGDETLPGAWDFQFPIADFEIS